MKITHALPKIKVSKDDCSATDFILTNYAGSFLSLSSYPISKYGGFFVRETFEKEIDLFKIIENITVQAAPPITEIINAGSYVKRVRGDLTETFILKDACLGFIYKLNKKAPLYLDLDCRRAYDLRTMGRYYIASVKNDHIIIHFNKKTDSSEDSTHGRDEFEFYIVVKPKQTDLMKDYTFVNEWLEVCYDHDVCRGDSPASRYVYRPFRLLSKELVIGVGKTQQEAYEQVQKLAVKKEPAKHPHITTIKKDKELASAFICAQDSLRKLQVNCEGLTRSYAGLPWFFQFWTRDESISLGATIKMQRYDDVKKILFQYISNIGKDGRIPNRVPSSDLGSADGVGWVFKRVYDVVMELKSINKFDQFFSLSEKRFLVKQLKSALSRIESKYMVSNLIKNYALETWMDTGADGDDRSGFRIEIQALYLCMLKLATEITGDKVFKVAELDMRKTVYDNFWNGNLLADGMKDDTLRPNVFLAYYIYPDLLSRKEWELAFDSCMGALWLDWGGFSTIDRNNNLFSLDYTGINNKSYHRGDSWYWINNIAAICLLRVNPIKFEEQINKIMSASKKEILWCGAVGHHAEVSSARNLSSHGCLAQAWSNSTFIELVMEALQ